MNSTDDFELSDEIDMFCVNMKNGKEFSPLTKSRQNTKASTRYGDETSLKTKKNSIPKYDVKTSTPKKPNSRITKPPCQLADEPPLISETKCNRCLDIYQKDDNDHTCCGLRPDEMEEKLYYMYEDI